MYEVERTAGAAARKRAGGRRVAAGTLALAMLLALAGCRSTPVLQPFTTDGCSMFPDRAPLGKADWCACCVAHDLAYWRGGTADERLAADRELERCVTAASGSPALAQAMFAGVRSGGAPYFPASYRWGYGWSYGRAYRALDEREAAQAAALAARYLAAHPLGACTRDDAPT